MLAGVLGMIGGAMMPSNDYTQRKTKVLGYKTGGKPFTRGRKTKSLRTRANRSKAKAKSRGK